METFIYIAKSITILSIFYIIYRIVLQKDTFFTANRHYLLSGIIAALILPFLEYTKTIYKELPSINTVMSSDMVFTSTPIETIPQQVTTPIDWWQIALLLYTLGILIMVARLIVQLLSLYRLINKYPKEYRDGYTYIEITDKAITPFSFFKTICYNPESHSPEELDMILAHEKVHVSQWHTFDVLLTQCVLAIQWLNPFAWLYKKSLEQNLEFIADNGAIQRVPSSLEYQRTLVKVSSTVVQPALTNNFYHSLIKKRIVMLNKQTSHRRNLWKLGLVLPALAIFMYSFNVKEVIKYTEVNNEHLNDTSTLLDIDSRISNKFYVNAETTATELDAIEAYFTANYPEKHIKFNDRIFHKNGTVKQFSFQTKFTDEEVFSTRFDKGSIDKDWSGYVITDTDNASIQIQELGNDGVTFSITKEKLEFNDAMAKQNPVFVINDETSDSELNTIESFFDQHYSDAKIKINNVKRDAQGALTHYTVHTIFEDAENGGDNIFENNTQNIKEGTSIHYEEGPAIIVKQLGNSGIGLKSTPNGLETSEALSSLANLTYDTNQIEQSLRNNLNTNTEQVQSLSEKTKELKRVYDLQQAIEKEVRVLISKNTTEEELKKLKKELKKDHDITLNYSTSRNGSGEITAITISYSGGSKNGNYSINGDRPIEDFYFYIDEEGESGFWSESHERRRKERRIHQEERRAEMKKHREHMLKEREIKREELKKYREELRSLENNQGKQAEERRKEIEKRLLSQERHLAERKAEMEMRKAELAQHRLERKEEMKERMLERKEEIQERKERMEVHEKEMKEEMKERKEEMKERLAEARSRRTNWNHNNAASITITKNTTNEEIKAISSKLKSQGITFSLSKVKRNNRGEITSYKMKFNNNNGTESVSQRKTNDDSPIEPLHIVYSDGNIQVHN